MRVSFLVAGLAIVTATAAMAQPATGPGPTSGAVESPGRGDPEGGRHHGEQRGENRGEHRGEYRGEYRGMGMRTMMEAGRGARFEIRRGDTRIDVKCAPDEPMKACVEAATVLFDKVSPAAK